MESSEAGHVRLLKYSELIGFKFGRLTVNELFDMAGKRKQFQCTCDCGKVVVKDAVSVKFGNVKSCGCLHTGETSTRTVNARKRHPLYQTWTSMIKRCCNPKTKCYKHYGGRGISVCDRWSNYDNEQHPFWAFVEDMGEKPRGFSIDRIDNEKGYSPENCRWVSHRDQMQNLHYTLWVNLPTGRVSLSDYCKANNKNKSTIKERARRKGISITDAATLY